MTPQSFPNAAASKTLFAILMASLLVLSACRTSGSIQVTDASDAVTAQTETTPTLEPEAATEPTEPDTEPEAAPEPAEAATETPADEPDTEPEPEPEPEPTATPEPASPADPLYELQGELPLEVAEVNAIIEFIQVETGRDFLRPPVIVAQSAEEFEAGLQPIIDDFIENVDVDVRGLQSLGLTDQGVADVSQAFIDVLSSPEAGVQGYYDTETDELYVPIGVLGGDEFRSLLVHELTHALDGQQADLLLFDRLIEEAEISNNYEAVAGLQAVVEGRATSVQNRWIEASAIVPEEPDLSLAENVPPSMLLELSIPYAFGEQFIELNGGPGNTWDLIENPPQSSEEILSPGTGIGVEEIVDVPVPAADGPVISEVSFGAADMLVWLLGESLEPQPSLIAPTLLAIDGWAGGNSVLWGDDTESCTRISFAADSADDLTEIQEVIELWVEAGEGRTVVADGDLVTVTGCAPYVP